MDQNVKIIADIQDYFHKHKYVVIRKFLDENTAALLYQYSINKVKAMDFKFLWDRPNYNGDWDGNFGDEQAPISYSSYGDVMMDTILVSSVDIMQKYTGLELVPNYTYWRLYQKGEVLKRHSDRFSCEISTTLCLGYNITNLDPEIQKDYSWPMYIESSAHPEVDGVPVSLNPGDMIIYRGCDLEHWRDEFMGLNHSQVFLHYNDKNGPYKTVLDGRPTVGIPKKFQV